MVMCFVGSSSEILWIVGAVCRDLASYIHGDNMCFLHYQPQNIGNLYVVYMFRPNCLLFLTFRSHRLSNMPSTCRRSVFGDGKIEKLRWKLPSGVIKHGWKIPERFTMEVYSWKKSPRNAGFSGKPCLITRGIASRIYSWQAPRISMNCRSLGGKPRKQLREALLACKMNCSSDLPIFWLFKYWIFNNGLLDCDNRQYIIKGIKGY